MFTIHYIFCRYYYIGIIICNQISSNKFNF